MWADFWDWLGKLPPGSASFVGTFTGWALGLIALVIGALVNASFNRGRDNKLRDEDRTGLASTLLAELSGIYDTMIDNAKDLRAKKIAEDEIFVVPDLSLSRQIFPHMLPKIGLLDTDTIRKVITAYVLVGQYPEALVLLGGKPQENMPKDRQLFSLDGSRAKSVAVMTETRAEKVKVAIDALVPYLK